MKFCIGDFITYTDKEEEYSGRVIGMIDEENREIEIYINEESGIEEDKMTLEVNISMLSVKDFTKPRRRRGR